MTKSTLPVVFTLALLLGGCGADVAALQDPPTFKATAEGSGSSLVIAFGARDSAQCPGTAPLTFEIKSNGAGYQEVRLAPGKDGVVYFVMPSGRGFSNEPSPPSGDRYYRVGTYAAPAGGLTKDAAVTVKLDDGVAYETLLPRLNMASCTRRLTVKTLPAPASPAPEVATF